MLNKSRVWSLKLVSFLVGLGTYQHLIVYVSLNETTETSQVCSSTWWLRWQPEPTTYTNLSIQTHTQTCFAHLPLLIQQLNYTASSTRCLHDRWSRWQLLLRFALNLVLWVTSQTTKAEMICKLSLMLVLFTCTSTIKKKKLSSNKLFPFLGLQPCRITVSERLLNVIGRPTFCARGRAAIYLCLLYTRLKQSIVERVRQNKSDDIH